jgi:hypothetical protein
MTPSVRDELIADLSRDLVARAAPRELPLFRAVSDAYLRDHDETLEGQAGKDEMLGFGAEAAVPFLTPVALAVTTQVVAFVTEQVRQSVAEQGSGLIDELVKRMFKKFRSAEDDAKPNPPPLTPEQLAQVRRLAIEKARQLNLADVQAGLLADSIVGSLAITTP